MTALAYAFALTAMFAAASSRAAVSDDAWKAYSAGDYAKAKSLCQAPADAGSAPCQAVIGWLYSNGSGVKQDYAEAMKWLKKAAGRGDPSGEHGVGWLYFNGWGVEKDYAEAAKWWTRAAGKGNADCQQGLGYLYQNGWGVPKDHAAAFKWFKKSADQGNHWGENGLAGLYFWGWGVKQDLAEAGRLWTPAAEGGNPYAPNGLGYLYRMGLGGIPKDSAKARYWFRAGIERGDLAYSTVNLGAMFENGEGVTQDFIEAYKWYLIGAAHEGAGAREGMERLKALMTKEQIAEAQKLAAASEAANHGQASPMPGAAAAPAAPALSSAIDRPSYARAEKPDDFALVVGIEAYSGKDLPKAAFAERDADAVAAHLRALGVPPRNLRVLKGSDATAGKLRGYIESWLPKNVKPGSRVYFYFSGHGAPNPQTGDAYLLPWDGDPALLKETAEPLKELYAGLGRLKAAEVVVALDACFSGAGGRSVIQKGTRPLVTVKSEQSLPERLSMFAAAEGDQTAGTIEAEGHGLFTYYFLDALEKDRKTSRELCDHLKPKVADAAARENRAQTPSCRGAEVAF